MVLNVETPALLHTMSTWPKRSRVDAASTSTEWRSATSVRTEWTRSAASAPSASRASSSASNSMSAITTRQPAARNASARPNPIPLAPPVTTATLSSSSSMRSPLGCGDGNEIREGATPRA